MGKNYQDTYQFSQYWNLVKEFYSSFFINVILLEHFDSSLSSCLSMNAYSYFSKSSRSQDFSNSIKVTESAMSFPNEARGLNSDS